jgi:arylsulfatase A-like enzyme
MLRFTERAHVYHNHYSTGGFTNPGTASLLTGTYPWTHRALRFRTFINPTLVQNNIFNLLSDQYYRMAYSHNVVVNALLHQFFDDLDILIPTRDLCLLSWQIADKLFKNDYENAVWRERLIRGGGPIIAFPTSLEWYALSSTRWDKKMEKLNTTFQQAFPRGLPNLKGDVFMLENAIDWLTDNLPTLPQPFISYIHFLPPHDPYNPRSDFIGKFDDGLQNITKPEHHFTAGYDAEELRLAEKQYDEFIAYADEEFGRLYDYLLSTGILENTMLIITSDHGEMFERGIWGHSTETVYDSLVRIPLFISHPGQNKRVDTFIPTSSVDVVPTILHETAHTIPDWCEGNVLPGFTSEEYSHSVFSLEAKGNSVNRAIQRATIALMKENYKLIRYFGYPRYDDQYELYNIADDPYELENLYEEYATLAADMRQEISAKLAEVNAGFQ